MAHLLLTLLLLSAIAVPAQAGERAVGPSMYRPGQSLLTPEEMERGPAGVPNAPHRGVRAPGGPNGPRSGYVPLSRFEREFEEKVAKADPRVRTLYEASLAEWIAAHPNRKPMLHVRGKMFTAAERAVAKADREARAAQKKTGR